MKKNVFFLISLYLSLICLFVFIRIMNTPAALGYDNSVMSLFEKCFYAAWIGVSILLIVSYILTLVSAVQNYFRRDVWYLKKMMLTMKMATIPFFILNFLFFVVVLGLIILVSRGLGVILLPIVPGVVTVTYLIMLLTSVFSIVFLIRLKKLKAISTGSFILHIILQLFFCIDTIDTLVLAKTYSKKNFPELLNSSISLSGSKTEVQSNPERSGNV